MVGSSLPALTAHRNFRDPACDSRACCALQASPQPCLTGMPCSCSRSTSSSQGSQRRASALGTALDRRQGWATEWDGRSSLLVGGRVGCQPPAQPRLRSAQGPARQVRLHGSWAVRPHYEPDWPSVHLLGWRCSVST